MLKGSKHSEESINKMVTSNKGQRRSPETEFKKGLVPWNKNVKGFMATPHTAWKKGHIPWNKNKKMGPLNEEHKHKITTSLLNRNFKHSKESIKKMSESKIGHKVSKETRLKLSNYMKQYYKLHPEMIEISTNRLHKSLSSRKRTKIELLTENIVKELGFKYVTQYKVFNTIIDICLPQYKIAIYTDGCYWHSCPLHFPNSILGRTITDNKINKKLRENGWYVIRLWEHDLINKDYGKELLSSFLNLNCGDELY